MTPEFIMRAGIRDYLNGMLDGQGNYVSQSHLNPPPYWDSLESQRRWAESAIENMNWASDYTEPGYHSPAKGILFADWNHVSKRTIAILERAGYELEWYDEWSTCDQCGRAVRTSPDSYSYQPSYVIVHDCEIVCNQCMLEDDSAMTDHLRSLENKPSRALNLTECDPAKYGYRMIEAGFENDDPKEITRKLRQAGIKTPLLFKVDSTGQFDIGFSVWTRDDQMEVENNG